MIHAELTTQPNRITTRRREHAAFDTDGPTDGTETYSIYLWDHEEHGWDKEPYAASVRLMELRKYLRALDPDWSSCSYLVERD